MGWRRVAAVAGWVALLGCDQFAVIGQEQAVVIDSGVPPVRDAMVVEPVDATMSEPDAMVGPLDDAAVAGDAGPDGGAACPAVQIQGCNPVTNDFMGVEGCGPGFMQQCGIDQLSVLTGYCIFTSATPSQLGGACFNSGVTESCPPTSTCSADGICREICLCDADCPLGQCCKEPVGATGFSLCGDC